jgi:hypothetical protein
MPCQAAFGHKADYSVEFQLLEPCRYVAMILAEQSAGIPTGQAKRAVSHCLLQRRTKENQISNSGQVIATGNVRHWIVLVRFPYCA